MSLKGRNSAVPSRKERPVVTPTAPASISEFFHALARLSDFLDRQTLRLIRKAAKAFGTLEDVGFTEDHLQVIIDDYLARNKVMEVLKLHLDNPYLDWYKSLPDAEREHPYALEIWALDIPVLSKHFHETVRRQGWPRVGTLLDWNSGHVWDVSGMTLEILGELQKKLWLLGYKTQF
jgi:hypothetical protein